MRIKNKAISKQRRKRARSNQGIDIEDPYWIGNKDSWSWYCKMPNCGAKMYPYKQDEYGDIVMACSNPNCIKSGNFANSISVQLKRLLKQQQNNSVLYYRRYDGKYY